MSRYLYAFLFVWGMVFKHLITLWVLAVIVVAWVKVVRWVIEL